MVMVKLIKKGRGREMRVKVRAGRKGSKGTTFLLSGRSGREGRRNSNREWMRRKEGWMREKVEEEEQQVKEGRGNPVLKGGEESRRRINIG